MFPLPRVMRVIVVTEEGRQDLGFYAVTFSSETDVVRPMDVIRLPDGSLYAPKGTVEPDAEEIVVRPLRIFYLTPAVAAGG